MTDAGWHLDNRKGAHGRLSDCMCDVHAFMYGASIEAPSEWRTAQSTLADVAGVMAYEYRHLDSRDAGCRAVWQICAKDRCADRRGETLREICPNYNLMYCLAWFREHLHCRQPNNDDTTCQISEVNRRKGIARDLARNTFQVKRSI